MPPPNNSRLDVEALMERIRKEVSSRRELVGPRPAVKPSRHYVAGTLLRFGNEGNAGPFLGSGWSYPETNFQWTADEVAEIVLQFEGSPGDMVLSFTAHPHLGGETSAQEVTVSWNGALVGEWTVAEGKSFHTLIMSHITGGATTGVLRFHIPGSFSQTSRNLGGDPRRLGIAVHELVLRPASELGF